MPRSTHARTTANNLSRRYDADVTCAQILGGSDHTARDIRKVSEDSVHAETDELPVLLAWITVSRVDSGEADVYGPTVALTGLVGLQKTSAAEPRLPLCCPFP